MDIWEKVWLFVCLCGRVSPVCELKYVATATLWGFLALWGFLWGFSQKPHKAILIFVRFALSENLAKKPHKAHSPFLAVCVCKVCERYTPSSYMVPRWRHQISPVRFNECVLCTHLHTKYLIRVPGLMRYGLWGTKSDHIRSFWAHSKPLKPRNLINQKCKYVCVCMNW